MLEALLLKPFGSTNLMVPPHFAPCEFQPFTFVFHFIGYPFGETFRRAEQWPDNVWRLAFQFLLYT